jgi:hypothetical protein
MVLSLLQKLDWLNVIAGFLLGLTPSVVPALVRLAKAYRSAAREKYNGAFHLYHWSASQELIRHKRLTFSISIKGDIDVRGARDPVTGLTYRGSLEVGSLGLAYIDIRAEESGGNLLFVINNPVSPDFETTTGLLCASDLTATPTAWRCLLSRTELSDELIHKYLGPRELLTAPRILIPVKAPAEASVAISHPDE